MNEFIELEDQLRLIPLEYYVFLCITLFSIGVTGVLLRRNMINVFLSIELMLNSVNLLAVSFSVYYNDPAGQAFVFFCHGGGSGRSGSGPGNAGHDLPKCQNCGHQCTQPIEMVIIRVNIG